MDDGTIQDLICAIDDPPVDAQKRQCVISRLKAATRSSRVRDVLISYLLRRSFELDSKLRMASAQTVILRKSLDALKSAIVLLQQNGKVIFVNATAERLIGQCPELRIEQDKFCSMRRADTLRLEQLTKEATGAGGRRPSGGAITIERDCNGQNLQVIVVPIPLDSQGTFTTEIAPIAMLVISDPNEKIFLPYEILSAMFGVTPSEARLLLALSSGQTLRQYSNASHVSQNTARFHLKNVFVKTKTSRQSDLARLIGGLAQSVEFYAIYIYTLWDFYSSSLLLCADCT